MRHFDDIVPRTESDEILAHIYSALVEIRDLLAPPTAVEPGAVVTDEQASVAASVLATHEHQTADIPAPDPDIDHVEEPKPAPAPKKTPAKRKPQAKNPAPRKKPA